MGGASLPDAPFLSTKIITQASRQLKEAAATINGELAGTDMTKRGASIAIGTVLLVFGLAGLGLLQTGVINPPASLGLVNQAGVKSPEPAPAPESAPQAQGRQEQTAQPPIQAPQPGGGPPAQVGQQPPAAAGGGPAVEKQVPVPQVGKGERRYPKQDQVTQPPPSQAPPKLAPSPEKRLQARPKIESKRYARRVAPSRKGKRLVIKFKFDPARDRPFDVARVHLGDKIRVKVYKVGRVDRRVYFTFSRNIDSPQGAVLQLKTMYSFKRPSRRPYRGYYEIEVKIIRGNRWNIMPRSFV
jgi:hypothetical protein